jgi:single-strand DNA-binding protein
MNTINLIGRCTNIPELKTTNNGVSVTSFTLAVDRTYTPKGQEKQTDFIPCVAWRSTAEFISKHFRKGQRIAVKGELQSRQYTANDGSQRKVLEVIVDGAFFCENKGEPSIETAAAMNNNQFEEVISDEDLPF